MALCPNCGREVPPEAVSCPNCGRLLKQPQSSERELIVLENALEGNTHFDIYLTDRRVVGIHSFKASITGASAGFGALGGLVELGVGKLREGRWKEKEEAMKVMTLDEKLAADKKNFSLSFAQAKKVELKKFLAARSIKVEGAGVNKTFTLTKEQFERLKTVLPTIPGLAGKLKVPD